MAFNYYSGVVATALTSGASSGDTDLSVDDGSTYPDPAAPGYGPYKILVGFETSREEVCLVTAKPSANVLRVTRAQDSTPATAKNAGDVIVVGASAADWREINLRLPLAGGTMTGNIVLAGAPSSGLHPATKTYVDTADALALPKAGGTMTGALTLSGAPTVDLHASTKKYVDDSIAATFTYQDHVPTVAQGASTNIPKTVIVCRYANLGDFMHYYGVLELTGAGTAGSAITVTSPLTIRGYGNGLEIGVGRFTDLGTANYNAICYADSAGKIELRRTDTTPTGYIGADPNIAAASGDTIRFSVYVEVA